MTDLGDRMKEYEAVSDFVLPKQLPVIVRLDGRSFSSLTRKLKLQKPMDLDFHQIMIHTTTALCEEAANARIGYTQSDEISILLYPKYVTSDPFFGNRICKIVSSLASLASVVFYKDLCNRLLDVTEKEIRSQTPTFDARAFVIPVHDAPNAFLWRLRDAAKNSISGFAERYFSPKELDGVNSSIRKEILLEKGIDWEFLPSWEKYGTAVIRKTEDEGGIRSKWSEVVIESPETVINLVKSFLVTPVIKDE